MFKTCQKIVWLDYPHSNTYCGRPEGHEGKCDEYRLIEDLSPEEQKEVIARTIVVKGTNG